MFPEILFKGIQGKGTSIKAIFSISLFVIILPGDLWMKVHTACRYHNANRFMQLQK